MIGSFKKNFLVLLLLLCFLGMSLTALGEKPEREIIIELSNFRLYLYQEGVKILDYPIAIGAPATPTPVGATKIVNRVYFPTYYPREWGKKGLTPIAPGPDNPVGTRWLGLSWPNYGIHGTNNPASIGKAVSDGCIRMFNEDVEELFEMIRMGTPVKIVQKIGEAGIPKEQERELNPEFKPGWFRVQLGAFEHQQNALRTLEKLKVAGYDAEVSNNKLFVVSLVDHFPWLEAKLVQFDLERLGFNVYITQYSE